MSAIPPHVVGSVLQSGAAQQIQAAEKDKAENAKADAARAVTGAADHEDILEVEATDNDTRVHTDSGGWGSQGRHDPPPEAEAAEDQTAGPADGLTNDEQGRPHLDVSA